MNLILRSIQSIAIPVLFLTLVFGTAIAQEPDGPTSKVESLNVVAGKAPPVSAVAEPGPDSDPQAALRSAKVIYVRSTSLLVGASVVEDKLQKRQEFQQLGLVLTRDAEEADLILELHHDLFTMYVFTAVDPRTRLVVASGKLSSLGGTVAGKVAERFLKQLMQARIQKRDP